MSRMKTIVSKLQWIAVLGSAAVACGEDLDVHFGRDIRPLLSNSCFVCHGPDSDAREAELRLDSFEFATKDRDGKAAIVPGDPEASLLYQNITTKKRSRQMPPSDSIKHRFTEAEVALIRIWIEQGAEYEPHWAYEAIARPEVPRVKNDEWCRNDVDRFILARLEADNLAPNNETSAATLCRRVFLDLTGLPPTIEELDAYLADDTPDAYERLIERLFTEEPYRTRYAERMATPWMDLARYADTSGIHMDAGRSIWPYRDWVIESYRENKPFDDFVIEQLAGDVLPDPTPDQVVASGFNRCHVTSDEGGAINDEWLLEYAVDRTSTFGTVFLGLSVGCARCHDHKFDPVSAEEFYGLLAFFNNNDEPGLYTQNQNAMRALEPAFEIRRSEDQTYLTELETMLAELKAKRDKPDPEEAEKIDAFLADLRTTGGWTWTDSPITQGSSSGGATMDVQEDGSILASGINPTTDEYIVTIPTEATGLRGVLLEVMTDPSLQPGRVGRPSNGNAVISGVTAEVVSKADPSLRTPIEFIWVWADHYQPEGNYDFKATNILRPDDGRVWALGSHMLPGGRAAMLLAKEPFGFEGGSTIELKVDCNSIYAQHAIGRFKVMLGTANETALARLPLVETGWYIVGPYASASAEEAYNTAFGPEEAGALALGKKYRKQAWRFAPGVVEATNVSLAQGLGAEYVGHEVYSPSARTLNLSMGSDDGLMVYRNGEKVFERKISRAVAADQEQIEIPLVAGRNTIVCKIINTGGAGGIYHRAILPKSEIPMEMVAALAPPSALRPDALNQSTMAWRTRFSPEYQLTSGEVKAVEESIAKARTNVPKTMVMRERPAMRETYVFTRGLYNLPDKDRPVTRGVPAAFGALDSQGTPTRLDLANWVVGENNPLTARVTANRYWELFFGRGIVETSDNLGLQGSWPSHPALLDWLSLQLRDGGWDTQKLFKTILTSATYRQSSAVNPTTENVDPDNFLLGKYPRQRLGAEQLRDQALYLSGLLVEKTGGPSVKPYQPEGLWRDIAMPSSNTRAFVRGNGDDLWRRSLYTYWKRAAPPPSMLAFDAPTREYCSTRRLTTNTPLQALVLWNDPQFVEAARMMATNLLEARNSEVENVQTLYRACTGEFVSDPMQHQLLAILKQYRARFIEHTADADQLIALGDAPLNETIPASELAAYTMLANAMLASDPTIVKD
jgi:hypothetical protein